MGKTKKLKYMFCFIHNMKIDFHLGKAKRLEATLKKLNYDDDYETMIEDYLLTASHYLNAAMHKLQTIAQDRDIKHNQLSGTIKREKSLGAMSEDASQYILQLEQLRPSHVYGKGENGNTAKKAEELFNSIKIICEGILNNEE